MSKATGTLRVHDHLGTFQEFAWNGRVEDKDAARQAFAEVMEEGPYLAFVLDAPGKATQVKTFEEIEKVERQRGSVVASVTPALVGG